MSLGKICLNNVQNHINMACKINNKFQHQPAINNICIFPLIGLKFVSFYEAFKNISTVEILSSGTTVEESGIELVHQAACPGRPKF